MKLGGLDISSVKLGANTVNAVYLGNTLVWQNAPVATAATGIGSTSFTANWNAYTGATFYLLDVSESSDFSTFVYENQIVEAPTTSYVVIGLNSNTTYYYRVRASDVDIDAQAFFDRVTTAGGTLSTTEQTAIDTLVKQMKADGIWTKMKAIYPMVGASAAACAQNLKSASFTGTFNGGVTFATTGVQFNGTNGYLDTAFVPSNEFSASNASISVYSRTGGSRNTEFGRYTGASNAIIAYASLGGNTSSWFGDTGFTTSSDPNNGLGLYNFQRTSTSNINVFANATKNINASTTFTGWPNLFMPIGAYFYYTSFSQSSGREFAFAHLGDALTDTEAVQFYNSVQAFQTTLSRQV